MSDKSKTQKGRSLAKSFAGIFNGDLLTREGILRNMPYLLFLALLGLVYISNGFITESTVRDLNKTDNELKEMRAEFISSKSELMFKSKQSKLEELIGEKNMELHASDSPPKKIIAGND
ncbi:MAG: FtsL-like putative cell division protein [Flavobacteriales bacterium]